MGLVGLGGLYFYFSGVMDDPDKIAKALEGFGVGASAVDNAAEALEHGATEVRHLVRREEMLY